MANKLPNFSMIFLMMPAIDHGQTTQSADKLPQQRRLNDVWIKNKRKAKRRTNQAPKNVSTIRRHHCAGID